MSLGTEPRCGTGLHVDCKMFIQFSRIQAFCLWVYQVYSIVHDLKKEVQGFDLSFVFCFK